MTVYADVVFITNFISTIALLSGYSAVFGGRIKLVRLILSGTVSGAYAVCESVVLIPHIMRIAVLFLLIAIAFGRKGVLLNTARFAFIAVCIEVLFILIMSLAGQIAFITDGSVTVFCSGLVGIMVYFLSYPLLIFIKRYAKKQTRKKHAEFVINGQKITLRLLYDSGNLLVYKGVSVAVISWHSIKDLFSDMDYDEFLITSKDRMIYNTVGSGGIIPVITPDNPQIDGSAVNIKIAVSQRLFNGYDGVVGELKGMDKNAVYKKFCQKVHLYKG